MYFSLPTWRFNKKAEKRDGVDLENRNSTKLGCPRFGDTQKRISPKSPFLYVVSLVLDFGDITGTKLPVCDQLKPNVECIASFHFTHSRKEKQTQNQY